MKEVKAVIQRSKLDAVVEALQRIPGLPGITISDAKGYAFRDGVYQQVERGKLEMMVPVDLVETVVQTIQEHAHTGQPGDGRIFIIPIEGTVRIWDGERTHGDL